MVMASVGASSSAVAVGAYVGVDAFGARWRGVVATVGWRRPRRASERTGVDAVWRMKSPDRSRSPRPCGLGLLREISGRG